MQGFISILKYILESNVINFILMLVIIAWLVNKFNLGKSFDESVKLVESGIKKSDDEKSEAQTKLEDAKSAFAKLPQDIEELKTAGQEKGEIFRKEIENTAQETISKLSKNIDSAIEVEEKKFSNLLANKTSAASIELAKFHLMELLKSSPELHNKFIQDSLDELDRVGL